MNLRQGQRFLEWKLKDKIGEKPVPVFRVRHFSVTNDVVVDALLVLARWEPAEGERAAVPAVRRHELRR
jgi:hypothetical protein